MRSSNQQNEEQQVLDAISSAFPRFLDGIQFVAEPDDPPDFLGTHENGQQVGLELTSWLDPEQTRRAQGRHRIREDLLKVVAQESHPRPTKVLSTVIMPNFRNVVRKRHYQSFRNEFQAAIHQFEEALPTLRAAHWCSLGATDRFDYKAHQRELRMYPTVSKYVESIWFSERLASDPVWDDRAWVSILPDGGFYDPLVAQRALAQVIDKKIRHYCEERTKAHLASQKLSKLYLLVYAHPELFGTNTSYQTGSQVATSPVEGLAEVAVAATAAVGPAVFDGIFLFYPVWGSRWLAQLWPSFSLIGA